LLANLLLVTIQRTFQIWHQRGSLKM